MQNDIEFRLPFGVEAFVKSDQLRIFGFHRVQPILKKRLVEGETAFKRGQVRSGRAQTGRRGFNGLGSRLLKRVESGFLEVRPLQAARQEFRELGFMGGPVQMGGANPFELAAGFRYVRGPPPAPTQEPRRPSS